MLFLLKQSFDFSKQRKHFPKHCLAPLKQKKSTTFAHRNKNKTLKQIIMASTQETLDFIMDRLSEIEGISFRKMFGEYAFYFNGKVIGGVYDNRLLLKDTPSGRALLKEQIEQIPYPKAKPMLSITDLVFSSEGQNTQKLKELFTAIYNDLDKKKKH